MPDTARPDSRAPYSVPEVAELVGLHVGSVRRMIREDRFPVPAFMVGNRYKVSREVLDTWLAEVGGAFAQEGGSHAVRRVPGRGRRGTR